LRNLDFYKGLSPMAKKIILSAIFIGFTLGLASLAFTAPEEKRTATELAVTQPLEIWGSLRGENSPEPSTEYLEKMAVDFDKINNPLCAAAAEGNAKELEFLLRDGASPDSTDSLGISALSHAILNNNKKEFSLLMSAGANCNQKGPFGVTPLMLAANSEMTEMVSLLLLNGADPLVQNDDGETALSIAKRKNLHDVINLLAPPKKAPPQPALTVAKAAQPMPSDESAPSSSSNEPAQAPAKPAARKAVLNLAPQDIELLQMVKQGLTETAAHLIEAGANPNVRTDDGISPLIIAVSRNDLTTAEMLLQHRANADIRSEFDMTPLMIAAQNENPPMIRLLLQQGANPRNENIAGQSACDLGLASADASIRNLFNRCLE